MIRSPADHGLTTRSPMASGGFGIAAYVMLRCAFPLDWTRVSCRKYGSESYFGSPVQAQLLALRYRTYTTGRAGALRSFFLCGTMPGREGNASRRRTATTQLHFGFSLHP